MARILAADNSPFYRKLLSDALAEAGHEVCTAADGSEALELLTSDGPFDAVILDLVMPNLNGGRACRQIKSMPSFQATPVIILSGLREDEIDDAENLGADAFVAKMQAGAMLQHLTAALDEVLAGGKRGPLRRGFDAMHRREVVSELLQERRSRDVLLSSLSEGFLRLSETGRVIEANPAALDMLRLPESQLVNRPVDDILGCAPEMVDGLFVDGRRASCRVSIGERCLTVRGRGGGRDDERFVLITDAAAAGVADAESTAPSPARAPDLVLGELVSGVAHELKNPLTAILGYGELLLQFCADDRTRERLTKMQHEAQRCQNLVDSLLCLARKRQAYRRVQSLNAVVQRVLDGLRPGAESRGIEIMTVLAAGLPQAEIDSAQVEQAVRAVVVNALQAVESRPEGERTVSVRSSRVEQRLVVDIEDTGPGVPVGSRDRIFDPFFTTRRHEGSPGLGLAVARGVIEEHGGRIEALISASGARIRMEIPAAPQAPAVEAAPGDRSGPAVLVIDQEPVVVDLLEDVLSDAGFRVERAGNGPQALDRVTEIEFDAVLIDLKMPDLDGSRLFEAMTQRRPELASRVVFTTSDPEGAAARRVAAATGAAVLGKPFSIEEVSETCQRVAGRS